MLSKETKENSVILQVDHMRQLARYELTFDQLTAACPASEVVLVCPEVYSYTLDDLREALINLRKENPTIEEFGENWFYPMTSLSEAFDMDRARGWLQDEDDTPEELREYKGFTNLADSDWFDQIWRELEEAWEDCDDSTLLCEALDIDFILKDLDRYRFNKTRPIFEWRFTPEEMRRYAARFESGTYVSNASDDQLVLARIFIDKLISRDDIPAMIIKGYACYGGNRLYPCDWVTSRDLMLRLFELTDDPQYANTLGYIFYYGRCTGKVPEYEKAFHYFGLAAANGIYEGMYKLADMFRHGYGCQKSEKTAGRLYDLVYSDSIRNFLKGENGNFADAALRMGNVYAKGIGTKVDVKTAFYYYTEAFYAASLRAKDSDFFGDKAVVKNAEQALDDTRALLPEDYFRDYMEYDMPVCLMSLTEDRYRCQLTRTQKDDGEWELTGSRIATRACKDPENILITIPQIGYCKRTIRTSMLTSDIKDIRFKDDAEQILYDHIEWNPVDNRYEFYYDDDLTAWIKCASFRMQGRPLYVKS